MRVLLILWAVLLPLAPAHAEVAKPAALVADGIPPVPDQLVAATRPYMEFRTAAFAGWNAADRSMLITTRFGNVTQLRSVAGPMMARTQISFEAEPLQGRWSPTGDVLVVSKDAGGDEFYQLHTLANGRLDVASGKLTAIGDHSRPIAYGGARFAPDGTLWVTSDEDAEFQRLGTLDPQSGAFTPRNPETRWDVDAFDVAPDGRFVAYVVNEAGRSIVRLLDVKSGEVRTASGLPAGVVGALEIAPWGAIGLSFTSARSAADAYSIDPVTLTVTRWTKSETGGLDPNANVEPEFVEVTSFDGERVSGFLYLPDAARFPGRRPLIVNIHGGPESQYRPGFLGRTNYLIHELGIAVFYPNVRGSTGFGKRFVGLDNGPFQREDSVKDIGAFLDVLAGNPRLDPARFAVAGGSYGGYMCFASSIFYGDRLRGANCVVAISSFVTFLENTQGYRRDLRRVEYGDERDPAQRAKLMEISPLTRAREIKIPLLVVTGANDPRVPASEADQIIAAVRAQGGEAWHLLGQNEGHGFAKKENADYQFWASLMFWKQTLLAE